VSFGYLKERRANPKVGIKPYKDHARLKEITNRVNKAALQRKSIKKKEARP
jgi:hypothetical protein